MVQTIPKHIPSVKHQANKIQALRIEELKPAVDLVTNSFSNDPSVHAVLQSASRSQIRVILKQYVD